jgi:hypothetical protein
VFGVRLPGYLEEQIDVQVVQQWVRRYRGQEHNLVIAIGHQPYWTHQGDMPIGRTRAICQLDIILFVFCNVARYSLSNFMGVSIISEIGVVRYKKDGVFCAFQEIVPMF